MTPKNTKRDPRLVKAEARRDELIASYVAPSASVTSKLLLLINGLWTADGSVYVLFTNPGISLSFVPVAMFTQVYSDASIRFVVMVWGLFGKVGDIILYINDANNVAIQYRLKGWVLWHNTVLVYLNQMQGQKWLSMHIITYLHGVLLQYRAGILAFNAAASIIIQLTYNLTGTDRRQMSMADMLASLGVTLQPLPPMVPLAQPPVMSFLFILGFFMGDGSLALIFQWSLPYLTTSPRLKLVQKTGEFSDAMLIAMCELLNKIGIRAHMADQAATPAKDDIDHVRPGMTSVIVQGYSAITIFIIALMPYFGLLYWKQDQVKRILFALAIYAKGLNTTLWGIEALISVYNTNAEAIALWIGRVVPWWAMSINNNPLGAPYVLPVIKPNAQGVKNTVSVRFDPPAHSGLKRKQFAIAKHGGMDAAVTIAKAHRDAELKGLIGTLKRSYNV